MNQFVLLIFRFGGDVTLSKVRLELFWLHSISKKYHFETQLKFLGRKKSVIFGFFFDLRRLKVSGLRIESLNGAETGGNLPLCKHRVLLLNFFSNVWVGKK